jgi:2-oxoisovalerate dehydrogenase E1 component alpha subunit
MSAAPDPASIYRIMLLARLVDERIWQLNRQGRAHFAVPCAGHEGAAAGYAFALDPSRDYLVPHYRDLAALFVFGITPRDVFCHLFARANDPISGGRQMFAHWGDAAHRILSISSPQPNHVTHAVGMALASKIRHSDAVTWTGFGDGSSSKGDVHEAMNFASVHRLPVVFCCENNSYAISTPQEKQMAIQNVADRAAGYGMPGCVVDGNDPLSIYEMARGAIERARSGGGPSLVEIKVYRFLPHTSNDDDRRYRSREEVEHARTSDPVLLFRQRLVAEGLWSDERDAALRSELQNEVDEALAFAESSPTPTPEDAFTHVYGSTPN